LEQQLEAAVVQNRVTEFAVPQGKVVNRVLGSTDEDTAVSPDGLCQFNDKIRRLLVAFVPSNQPQLVADYRFLAGAGTAGFVPDKGGSDKGGGADVLCLLPDVSKTMKEEVKSTLVCPPMPKSISSLTDSATFFSTGTFSRKGYRWESYQLNIALLECYESFGITKDNASLLKPDGSFKEMPDFAHLWSNQHWSVHPCRSRSVP